MNRKLKYDAVVIGAGNGGLVAATRMAKQGMKVLLLEKHNVPGGFASSFVRGRFEFEPSLHELGAIGTPENKGCVREVFDSLGIEIDWCEIPELFVLNINNQFIEFPNERYAFARKVDELCPGSYDEINRFIDICYSIYDAASFSKERKGNVTSKEWSKYFPDYLTTGAYSLKEVLDQFKINNLAKEILASYCCYLGLPPSKLAFTLYAVMFAEYVRFGAYIPKNRSHEISSKILEKLFEYGGNAWFNTEAVHIDVENGAIKGVLCDDGSYIETNYVVANISPNVLYGKMLDKENVPEYDHKLVNYRKLNSQGFSFYVGLDVSPEELKLKSYSYFIFDELNEEKVFEEMKSIEKNNNYIVVCLNNANKKCSEKGTTILSFTTLYDDAWNDIKAINYVETKEKIAERMIKDFEQKMGINILDHIEEIEIATPLTFARYTNAQNGVIYGYAPFVKDGPIVRSKNMNNEINIKGLKFAGGYSFRAHGYSTTYVSGDICGWKTFGEFKKNGGN